MILTFFIGLILITTLLFIFCAMKLNSIVEREEEKYERKNKRHRNKSN